MKRIRILLVTIAALILITAISINYYFSTSPLALSYRGEIRNVYSQYGLTIEFYSNRTLFNAQVKVSYLATNGSWITTIKELGIVDKNPSHMGFYFPLVDLDYTKDSELNISHNKTFEVSDNTNLESIRIEAHGFLNP